MVFQSDMISMRPDSSSFGSTCGNGVSKKATDGSAQLSRTSHSAASSGDSQATSVTTSTSSSSTSSSSSDGTSMSDTSCSTSSAWSERSGRAEIAKEKRVILVDEKQRIFKVDDKTYCYSAEVFGKLLDLPCGGEDLKDVMRGFDRQDVSQHFHTHFNGATGYRVSEFHNFWERSKEKTVVNLMKRWNNILLSSHKQYSSKGNVVAAMSYVEGKLVNFPAYKSDYLHSHLKGGAPRSVHGWRGLFEAVINFHTRNCKSKCKEDLTEDQARKDSVNLKKPAVDVQPVVLAVVDPAQAPWQQPDFIANVTGEIFDQRIQYEVLWNHNQEKRFAQNQENTAMRDQSNTLQHLEKNLDVPVEKVHIVSNADGSIEIVAGRRHPEVKVESEREQVQDEHPKLPSTVNFIASVDGCIEKVQFPPSLVKSEEETMPNEISIISLASPQSCDDIAGRRHEAGHSERVEDLPTLQNHVTALGPSIATPVRHEKVRKEIWQDSGERDNLAGDDEESKDHEMSQEKTQSQENLQLETASRCLLDISDNARYLGPELEEAKVFQKDSRESNLNLVMNKGESRDKEMLQEKVQAEENLQFQRVCSDTLDSNHDLQPVFEEEMDVEMTPNEDEVVCEKALSKPRCDPDMLDDSQYLQPVIANLDQLLSGKKKETQHRLSKEAVLEEELTISRRLTQGRLQKEAALRKELEIQIGLTQMLLIKETALEKELQDSRAFTTKQKAAKDELQSKLDVLAIEARKLDQVQQNLAIESANFKRKRDLLEYEKSEQAQGVLRAAKMAKREAEKLRDCC